MKVYLVTVAYVDYDGETVCRKNFGVFSTLTKAQDAITDEIYDNFEHPPRPMYGDQHTIAVSCCVNRIYGIMTIDFVIHEIEMDEIYISL